MRWPTGIFYLVTVFAASSNSLDISDRLSIDADKSGLRYFLKILAFEAEKCLRAKTYIYPDIRRGNPPTEIYSNIRLARWPSIWDVATVELRPSDTEGIMAVMLTNVPFLITLHFQVNAFWGIWARGDLEIDASFHSAEVTIRLSKSADGTNLALSPSACQISGFQVDHIQMKNTNVLAWLYSKFSSDNDLKQKLQNQVSTNSICASIISNERWAQLQRTIQSANLFGPKMFGPGTNISVDLSLSKVISSLEKISLHTVALVRNETGALATPPRSFFDPSEPPMMLKMNINAAVLDDLIQVIWNKITPVITSQEFILPKEVGLFVCDETCEGDVIVGSLVNSQRPEIKIDEQLICMVGVCLNLHQQTNSTKIGEVCGTLEMVIDIDVTKSPSVRVHARSDPTGLKIRNAIFSSQLQNWKESGATNVTQILNEQVVPNLIRSESWKKIDYTAQFLLPSEISIIDTRVRLAKDSLFLSANIQFQNFVNSESWRTEDPKFGAMNCGF